MTSAGTTLSISAGVPAAFDQYGFEALDFTDVGEVIDIAGDIGRAYNTVTHNPLVTRATVKKKGSFNSGSVTLSLALDKADAGQILMSAALLSDSAYSFRVVRQDGSLLYFRAIVMSFPENFGGVDAITAGNATLEITADDSGNDFVEVSAEEAAHDVNAKALFARMTGNPSSSLKTAYNSLILALKSADAWEDFDIFRVFVGDRDDALLNIVSEDYTATLVNNPAYDEVLGFTGDGSTNYLHHQFNAATAPGAKYTQNSAHMGVWLSSDAQSSTQIDCGHVQARICGRASGTLIGSRSNASAGQTPDLGSSTAVGYLCVSRSASGGYDIVKNNGAAVAVTQTSSALLSQPFYSLGHANTNGTLLSPSTRSQRAFHCGQHLTETKRHAVYEALDVFFAEVDAVALIAGFTPPDRNYAALEAAIVAHPFNKEVIGQDEDGNDVYVMSYGSTDLPTYFISCALHGSEKKAAEIGLEFARRWAEDDAPQFAWLRSHWRLVIMPCCSPYGFNGSHFLNPNDINLNRNFDRNWSAYSPPDANNAKGASAFSELETQHVRDAFLAEEPFIGLDLHTNIGVMGFDTGQVFTEFRPLLKSVYDSLAAAMPDETFMEYSVGNNPTATGWYGTQDSAEGTNVIPTILEPDATPGKEIEASSFAFTAMYLLARRAHAIYLG